MNYVWIGKLLVCFTWLAQNNSQLKRPWELAGGQLLSSLYHQRSEPRNCHPQKFPHKSAGEQLWLPAREQGSPLLGGAWQEGSCPAPRVPVRAQSSRQEYIPEELPAKAAAWKLDSSSVCCVIKHKFYTLLKAVNFSGSPSSSLQWPSFQLCIVTAWVSTLGWFAVFSAIPPFFFFLSFLFYNLFKHTNQCTKAA